MTPSLPPTPADYARASAALALAAAQPAPDGRPCVLCDSPTHFAGLCALNPLVRAAGRTTTLLAQLVERNHALRAEAEGLRGRARRAEAEAGGLRDRLERAAWLGGFAADRPAG